MTKDEVNKYYTAKALAEKTAKEQQQQLIEQSDGVDDDDEMIGLDAPDLDEHIDMLD